MEKFPAVLLIATNRKLLIFKIPEEDYSTLQALYLFPLGFSKIALVF